MTSELSRLQIALLTLVSALIGASIPSIVSWRTTHDIVNGESSRQLHDDRRAAYADLVGRSFDFLSLVDEADRAAVEKTSLPQAKQVQLDTARIDVQQAVAVAELVGTTDARQVASDLGEELREYAQGVEVQADTRHDSRLEAVRTLNKFIDVAGNDLQ